LRFSPDARRIAVGTRGGNIVLFDAASGSRTGQASAGAALNELLFSPDGARLAVLPAEAPGQLWSVSPLERKAELTTEFGGSAWVDFSRDGRLLATADEDTRVRIYRAGDGALQAISRDFVLEPFAVAFARAGGAERLVVGGADGRLTLLDPASAKTVRQLDPRPDPVAALAVLGGGRSAVALYFHADAMSKPAPFLEWDLETGESRVLSAETGIVGGGVLADGSLRVVTVSGDEFILWALP
jgi:WD40 repeat protein